MQFTEQKKVYVVVEGWLCSAERRVWHDINMGWTVKGLMTQQIILK